MAERLAGDPSPPVRAGATRTHHGIPGLATAAAAVDGLPALRVDAIARISIVPVVPTAAGRRATPVAHNTLTVVRSGPATLGEHTQVEEEKQAHLWVRRSGR